MGFPEFNKIRMIKFFNKEEEARIVAAIRQAESGTSGEIRVHLEKHHKGTALEEAARVFHQLGMGKTEARNGVLLFIAPEQKTFAILGDQGINAVVPPDFWKEERDLIQTHFRQGAFCEGICLAVGQVGEKLKIHFPIKSDDINELPDEISYGI